MGLTLTCLVDSCMWIVAGASLVHHMTEQVSVSVLHPKRAQVNADRQKCNCRFTFGPTLDRQGSNQNKPATIEHVE